MLSDADVARYEEDGAVCLRGAVSGDWIGRLRAACGDDARYAQRVGPISPRLDGHGLVPGDPLPCAMFPKVWPR